MEPEDACSEITTKVAGKVALIKRGNCNFTEKILQAQNDYVTTATNTSISIDPLGNDSRSAEGVAILLDVSDPLNGTAAVATDGTIS